VNGDGAPGKAPVTTVTTSKVTAFERRMVLSYRRAAQRTGRPAAGIVYLVDLRDGLVRRAVA